MSNYEQMKNMLTTGEVARIFDVHTNTVRQWCDQGILKAYRIGPRGQRKFRQEDVAILLLKRAIQRYLKG